MTKRKIALLGAILALSATSMAGVIPLSETKGQMDVKARTTDRLGRERTEIEFNNIWLNDRNRLDIEWERNDYETGGDQSFVQFELFTQLSDSGRWELYTDFKPYNNEGTNSTTGYLDIMPTFVISRTENFSSVIRAGIGYDQGHIEDRNQTRVVGEFKNYWVVNNWLELEANAYFWNMNDTGYQKAEFEAYWYTNHELLRLDNGITISFLTEGGLDPYTFAQRESGNKEGYTDSFKGDYYFYFQPTVKINVPIQEGKYNVYLEPGYYMEANGDEANDRKSSDEGMFMRVGFSTKF